MDYEQELYYCIMTSLECGGDWFWDVAWHHFHFMRCGDTDQAFHIQLMRRIFAEQKALKFRNHIPGYPRLVRTT